MRLAFRCILPFPEARLEYHPWYGRKRRTFRAASSPNPYALTPPPGPFRAVWLNHSYGGFSGALLLYAGILAAGHILEPSAEAQLDALRRRIEPHFLLDTLNSIAGMIRENRNGGAVAMIARLSEFLRRAIHDSNRQLAPLGDELTFLQQYLDSKDALCVESA